MEELREEFTSKLCVYCHCELEPEISDETVFNPESHGGVYREHQQNWFPHYDVEFCCRDCGHYERFTYNSDGSLHSVRTNKVIFYAESKEFHILENETLTLARKLPDEVAYGSKAFFKHLDKVLEQAYGDDSEGMGRTTSS